MKASSEYANYEDFNDIETQIDELKQQIFKHSTTAYQILIWKTWQKLTSRIFKKFIELKKV